MKIRNEVNDLFDEVNENRKRLHQIPEIQLQTKKTKSYILEQLQKMDCDEIREDFLENSVVAIFYGSDKQHMIAYRADMDALAIHEESNVPFISQHEGYMHACGHDGHMAALLGLARYFSIHKVELKESVMLIFQPGEENPGGAKKMLENGLFQEYPVKCVFGTHLMPDIEMGHISSKAGPLMAQVSELYFDIYGKGAHGAMPQLGKDALLAASTLVVELQNIVSRYLNPIHHAVLTIGTMHAGNVRNALASTAHLEGTMRCFDEADLQLLKDKIKDCVLGVEQIMGVKIQYEIRDCYPIVNNDEYLTTLCAEVCGDAFLSETPRMIAEDFSYYQKAVPGLFYFTGTKIGNDETKLHDARFHFDEHALLYTIETNIRLYEAINFRDDLHEF